jgi:hypothetical protein
MSSGCEIFTLWPWWILTLYIPRLWDFYILTPFVYWPRISSGWEIFQLVLMWPVQPACFWMSTGQPSECRNSRNWVWMQWWDSYNRKDISNQRTGNTVAISNQRKGNINIQSEKRKHSRNIQSEKRKPIGNTQLDHKECSMHLWHRNHCYILICEICSLTTSIFCL